MKSILNFNKDELKDAVVSLGLKPYRSKQILDWVYKKFVFDFILMKNLSKDDQNLLAQNYLISSLSLEKRILSENKETMKLLFGTSDMHFIETVLIRSKNRNTVCISTQIGCALNCVFCATGKKGFIRDLKISEILSQILWISHELNKKKKKISNIVFMGMGEPFLNYDNLLSAIRMLNDHDGFNLGARHMTISTAGIIKGIKRFMSEDIQVRLAVSLNSPFQKIREKIMPAAKLNKLDKLINILKEYQRLTNKRITFEYIMLKGINMDESSIAELKIIKKSLKYNLNIIKYNRSSNNDAYLSTKNDIKEFKQNLLEHDIPFNERISKGEEIHAACGQLGSMK